MHRKGQHSPQSVRRSEGCLTFFRVHGGLLLFGLGSMPLALEADKDDFRQSLAMWPTPLQNMHKLLSKRRCHSCGVSFPSLPSFLGREAELPEDDCGLPDLLLLFWLPLFFLELFGLLFLEVGFLPFSSDLPESGLLLSGLFLLD